MKCILHLHTVFIIDSTRQTLVSDCCPHLGSPSDLHSQHIVPGLPYPCWGGGLEDDLNDKVVTLVIL